MVLESESGMLNRLRAFSRRPLAEIAYATLWKLGIRRRAPRAAHQAIFTRIHEQNDWGSGESRSGPGSTRDRGSDFREELLDLLRRFEIRSLLDAPCGDFNWMRDVTSRVPLSYAGVDVVESLILENNRLYADARHRFLRADITSDGLPAMDLIVCRDALVHFSFADIRATVANFKRSGSRYLLTTSFTSLPRNEEIRTGGWRPLNLQESPFGFPEPLAKIDDFPKGAGTIVSGKRLCLWELASLP